MDLFSHKRTLFLLAIIGGVLIWNYNRAPDHPPTPETQRQLPKVAPPPSPPAPIEPPPPVIAETPAPPPAPPAPAAPAPAPTPPSATQLPPGSANDIPEVPEDITEDLNAVDAAFRDFRAVFGENPIGSNAEITGALLGNNLKQIKLELPAGSQLNGEGQLCDRWGTPYFFHQVSATEMEIRSAGPDRRMWTRDDSQL